MSQSYTVVRGDTLWAIASRFYGQGHLFPVIAEANAIPNPDLIFPGQVLHIPDLDPSSQPTEPIEFRLMRPSDLVDLRCTAVGFRLIAAEDAPDPAVRHTVVRGDTLWDIAEHYYGDPRRYPEIAAANRIPNPDLIFPGQVFVIPGITAPPSPPPLVPAPPAPMPAAMTYRVVRGDSLWKIAARFYGDPRRYPEIAAANRIRNPDLIFPGQLLTIPDVPGAPSPESGSMTYRVQPGDTLWDIARAFYGDPRRYPEIAAANRIPDPDLIFPNQVLVIPGTAGTTGTTGTPAPPDPAPVREGTRQLVAAAEHAHIVVRFGIQNLFEQRDVPPGEVTRLLAARSSRVVFAVPVDTRIEFSVAGVLRTLPTLPLRVARSATPTPVNATDPDDEPRAPADDETSIEAPYRLVVSPGEHGAFVHDAEVTAAPGDGTRVQLWSTRLTARKVTADGGFDGYDDTQRVVRALHTRDDDTGTAEPPFDGSLTPQPEPPPADRRPAGDWRRTIVRQTSTGDATVAPTPLDVRRLALSAVGAWVDWSGRWPDSTVMRSYRHLAPMGRDAYVRVDEPGFLFPLGHRAVRTTVTERRLRPGPDPAARLVRRQFIVLHETTREYRGEARQRLPFQSATIATEVSPDLPGPAASIFMPKAPTGDPFFWPIHAVDHAGRSVELFTPLVFVPLDRRDELTVKEVWKSAGPITPGGREIALAPERVAGDTTVRVEELQLDGTLSGEADETCTPFLESARVVIPALAALNGGGGSVEVGYLESYGTGGFRDDKAQVFLELKDPTMLNFGGGSAGGGGFVQPNVDVRALSRTLGAIGDKDAEGEFAPDKFLAGEAMPKLFGLFMLKDLLSTAGLDKAPKLIAERLSVLDSLPAELQRLLTALDRTSAALDTAARNAAHVGARDSLQGCRSRADAVRAELVGAADPLRAALSDVLAGRPHDAAARAAELAAKLQRLDAVLSDPVLPAFARAVLERPRKALGSIIDVADEAGRLAALQALGTSVLRYDWQPQIGPWPAKSVGDDRIFIPPPDGLTISVEVRPAAGREPTVDVSAQLVDFRLALLPEAPLMELRFSRIGFRTATGRKPEIDVVFDGMQFLGPLAFIEKLREVIPFDGFADPPYVDISPAGVTAGFDLALPSVAIGVFSLENIALAADCRVPFLGDAVTVGFGFCSKDRPFRLTVMAIGGGGWVAIRLSPAGLVVLEMGLEGGAALSLDFGVASGSVSVMIGVYLRLEGSEGQLTGYFRIRGEVDVLGLASASITLELSLTYDSRTGKLVGRASLRVEVEVMFFSASVEVVVERRLAGSEGDPKLIDVMPPDEGGQDMWESYFDAFAVGA
jgi:nucleoid-associated protein YgaU